MPVYRCPRCLHGLDLPPGNGTVHFTCLSCGKQTTFRPGAAAPPAAGPPAAAPPPADWPPTQPKRTDSTPFMELFDDPAPEERPTPKPAAPRPQPAPARPAAERSPKERPAPREAPPPLDDAREAGRSYGVGIAVACVGVALAVTVGVWWVKADPFQAIAKNTKAPAESAATGPAATSQGAGGGDARPAGGPGKAAGPGTKYAFIVAVSKYDEATSGLKPLPYTVKDVEGFRDALLATGYEEKNIRLLHDELPADKNPGQQLTPERAKIVANLKKLLAVIEEEDSLVVVLNGHGINYHNARTSHFCPLDAAFATHENMLEMDGLYQMLEKCKAGNKLLIAGMCRNDPNGFPANTQASTKIDLETPEKPPTGIAALYSCAPGQMTYFDPKTGSYFFNHLSAAWCGEYADGDEVTLDDVFKSVRVKTKQEVFEKLAADQSPQTKQHFDGTWAIPKATGRREPKPGTERDFEIAHGVRVRFCWVPGSTAVLGSPTIELDHALDEKERPFETRGFWLSKFEVTQGDWRRLTVNNPSHFKGDKRPVESVTFDACQAFVAKCRVKGCVVKLPTEDEWEYACRGGKGNKTAFYWGDVLNGDKANHNGTAPYNTTAAGDFKQETTDVGHYEKFAPHPWGLCDMHGNVREWCDSPRKPGDPDRAVRGGCWSFQGTRCRAAFRNWAQPSAQDNALGFRLCLVP